MITALVSEVSAGDTVLTLDSEVGFNVGDMIKLTSSDNPSLTEFVEITGFGNTTNSSARRLATYVTVTVTPPVSRSYPAGAVIQNAGPAILFTGSDPITFFGGQKFKFWLPLHEELLMLQTEELQVYGQVFPGPDPGLQWFGHLRVLRTDGTPVALAQVKRGALNQTSSRCASRKLDSMDVFLGTSASPLRELSRRPMEFVSGEDVRFEINCRQQARPQLSSSRTEYLHFETASIAFLIVAAHAGNEFPNDPKLAMKYKHLDFLILEMPRKETFSGVLPEIWGLLPRSPTVEAMLVPPESEALRVCSSGRPDAMRVNLDACVDKGF